MGHLHSSPSLLGEGDHAEGVVEGHATCAGTSGAPLHHRLCRQSPSPSELGEEFAGTASRLAGFAGAVLGWSPDAFWRATPAELAAIVAVLAGGETAAPPDAATMIRLQEEFPDG